MPLPTQALDLNTVTLSGINLIEASAGTGKTYTIAGLFLRLLLDAGYRVDQILVVTFTNAATEELKDRIRSRLIAAKQAFYRGYSEEDLCAQLIARCPDRELALRRLDNAIRGFDEAAIYTIHSFCQRVLKDRAFASGMAFDLELQADQSQLIQQIADDFWRLNIYQSPSLLVDYLLAQRYTPSRLLAEIRPYINKPHLHVIAIEDSAVSAVVEQAFGEAYQRVRQLWLSAHETVRALLDNNPHLNRNRYRPASLNSWFEQLDEYLQPESPNLNWFERLQKFTPAELSLGVKKGGQIPQHEFFIACEQLEQTYRRLADNYQLKLRALRTRLLSYCNEQLPQRKAQRQQHSYDDLLSNLFAALHDKTGPGLANSIRKRYPAALIDEFQDTDPLQYAIFRRLYVDSESPVFIVGDPKQAIYSFRGADIFAYLRAPEDAQTCYTLTENWRSEPALIAAINTLFSRTREPFLFSDIQFVAVAAADRQHEQLLIADETSPAPFQLWMLQDESASKPLAKTQAMELAARATAVEIVRLLNLAAQGEARLGTRALAGSDIAVLVPTHRHGRIVRRELLRLGVPSVQHAQDNVFDSREAQELEYLLMAIAEPNRSGLLKAALATRVFGFSVDDILALALDQQRWEYWLDRFYAYRRQWLEQGLGQCMHQLMRENNCAQRLLSFVDGERRLTNQLHLIELLQTAALEQRLGVEATLKWLAERRLAADREKEDYQLRLESDERLVQIVTVHKAKGLEYPLVFCPFQWDGRLATNSAANVTLQYHDPDNNHQAVVDLGSPQQQDQRARARFEELAEKLRLLYVALTRAKNRCYMVWGHIRDAGFSAPAWLLHRPGFDTGNTDIIEQTATRYEAMSAAALRAEVEKRAAASAAAISVSDPSMIPAASYQTMTPGGQTLRARPLNRPVDAGRQWRISSFSSMTARRDDETPDFDASPGGEALLLTESHRVQGNTLFSFPRGARAGSCLHKIFEKWDFSCTDRRALEHCVAEQLRNFGFADNWTPVLADTLEQVIETPLNEEGLSLRRVEYRLDEMEFYYPLNEVMEQTLRQTLLKYLPEPFQAAVRHLNPTVARGYMKGFIDLVFASGQRFYIVDYKSNWLGGEPADYNAEKIVQAMARGDYYLQYLIYTLALHRYLHFRLPDYHYDEHFGGVFYLFLRGMVPGRPGSGIFFDRPDKSFIDALDRLTNG